MELEKAKERIIDLIRVSEEGAKIHPQDRELFLTDKEALETALKTLETSIPKEVIENKLEDYQERKRYYDDENIVRDNEYYRIEGGIKVLQELLEENRKWKKI